MTIEENGVWVFHGTGGHFASGVFSSKENAEQWIERHGLTGILTLYPLDKGVYEWSLDNHSFTPKKPEHTQAGFIQKFSSASQDHYHYENGDVE